MTAYERRPERRFGIGSLIGAGFSAAGRVAARNPAAVGGTTAFFVALSFVSANAVWYQPQQHPGAFVATRERAVIAPKPQPVPAPRTVEPQPSEPAGNSARQITPDDETATATLPPEPGSTGSVNPGGDPTVRSVQRVLKELGLYDGHIDGMAGPQTSEAVDNYRRIVGLEAGGGIDTALLEQLGLKTQETTMPDALPAAPPAPTPAPRQAQETVVQAKADAEPESAVQMASVENSNPTVQRVQAGLKAFGNEVEVDGILGESTQKAIREFQSLFGLPVTGKPDEQLLTKMREVGLIN